MWEVSGSVCVDESEFDVVAENVVFWDACVEEAVDRKLGPCLVRESHLRERPRVRDVVRFVVAG